MTQIWNIFRKDVRRHWKEIVLSLAILAAFAWFEIRSWTEGGAAATGLSAIGVGFFASRLLSSLVNVLVPTSWLFLIVRVVHGEALVGDRQFWVTRPYDWRQLLVAKACFVLTFVNLPLLMLDFLLLARAGFHPTAYLSGLMWMQLMWILTVFLAAVALASVTATIPQMLLALLLIVLYMVGMQALSQTIPSAEFSGVGDNWAGLLFVITALAVILLQYSRRRTNLSRSVIAGLCGLLALITVLTPYRSLIAREYPSSRTGAAPHLSLQAPRSAESPYYLSNKEVISISLPLDVSGIAKDSLIQLNGIIVTLTGPTGFRWDSGWRVQSGLLFAESKSTNIYFELKQKAYDQLKSTPVTAHLLLAFTSYEDQNQRSLVVPAGEFNLPEVGLCSTQPWNSTLLRCLTPMRKPRFLLLTTETTASTCPLRKGEKSPTPGDIARGWIQGGSEPAEIGISPIHEANLYLFGTNNPEHGTVAGLCPGTPFVLSNPESTGRNGIELILENLKLEDYRQGAGRGQVILRSQ